jgi:Na+-driven multidrug efflux pump
VAMLAAPAEVVSLLWVILAVEALSAVGRSVTVVTLDGLRASGDVQFPVKASVTVNIVMGVGLAWLLGVHFQMGLVGLWIGYTADEWVRGAIMLWRWQTQGWVRYARASRRRVLLRRWQDG